MGQKKVNKIRSSIILLSGYRGTINQIDLYRAESILLNNRQEKTLNYLKKNKFITAPQYAHRFGISTRMATRDLKQLVQWGKLNIIGKARSTKYIIR